MRVKPPRVRIPNSPPDKRNPDKVGFVRIFSLFRREDVIRQLMPSPVSIASAEDIFD